MLPPATNDAKIVSDLYNFVYIFGVIAFIIVEGLLLYTAIKFRRQTAGEMPFQNHGNNRAELTWTVIPALVVAMVFFISMDATGKMTGHGSAANPVARVHALGDAKGALLVNEAEKVDLIVEVTGRQWFWQFAYKRDGDVTSDSNENKPLVLPAGKRIRLDLTAADVIHAWWLPELGPMIYVNPGERSYIYIDNVAPGEFKGQCNVFCGVRHAYMLLNVKFVPEAEFETWYKSQAAQ
jgi:cytochrome c oxidase subunit II